MIFSSLKSKEAFKAGYFYGFFLNLFCIYWVALVTVPGVIGAVILLAAYVAILFWLFNKIFTIRKIYGIVLFPFLWVGVEYFRTLTEFSFPWSDIGYTQSYYLKIMQIVSVTSVHGLSFLIVLVNVLLWQVFRKNVIPEKKLTSVLVSAGIVVGLICYGWIVMPEFPLPGKKDVVLLQGSVPIEVKWKPRNEWHSFRLYDSLAQSAADTIPQLFIWPETAAPADLSRDTIFRRFVENIARKSGGYHLVGAMGTTRIHDETLAYNSCYQFSPDGEMQERYDKVKLVPFSEHSPYQDYLPFLRRDVIMKYLTFIKTYNVQWWSDFSEGDSLKLFKLPDYSYAVLICFESTFPEFSREAIQKGASLLVGITNDTWFGKSIGIYMHARIFVTRAIENRCWGVRVGNSGLSYVVDKYGRIRDSIEPYAVEAMRSKVNLLDGISVFTKYGDIIGLISFLITISLTCIFVLSWLIGKILRK